MDRKIHIGWVLSVLGIITIGVLLFSSKLDSTKIQPRKIFPKQQKKQLGKAVVEYVDCYNSVICYSYGYGCVYVPPEYNNSCKNLE